MKRGNFVYILSAVFFVELADALKALIPTPDNKDETENLKLSLREIIKNYFPTLKDIAVISDDSTWNKIGSFVIREIPVKWIQVTWDKSSILPFNHTYEIVLIILKDLKKMTQTLFSEKPFWKSLTKFVVIHDENLRKKEIFKIFWKVRVVNVLLLTDESGKISGYTYSPYEKCEDITEILTLERGSGEKMKIHKKLWEFDPGMNGCEITLSYMDFVPFVISKHLPMHRHHLKGIEGEMMRVMGKVLNFTATYKNCNETNWGGFHPPEGLLGDVYSGASEIGFGVLFSFANRYPYLDVAAAHSVDECIGWVVPKGAGKNEPEWIRNFILEFDYPIWIALFVSLIVVSLLSVILNRFDFDFYSSWDLYSSFLGYPIIDVDSNYAKVFLCSWLWYGYILTTAYKSSMSSLLTAPTQIKDIETLKDLSTSDLHITGPFNALRVVRMAAEQELGNTQKTIADRFEISNQTVIEVLGRMVKFKDVAFIRHISTFQYMSMIHEEAKGKIYVVDECFYQYYPWVVLKKSSYLTEYVDSIIYKLNEAGLLLKWKTDLMPRYKKDNANDPKRICVSDVKAVFLFLFVGYVLSVVCFIGEVFPCYKKYTAEISTSKSKA